MLRWPAIKPLAYVRNHPVDVVILDLMLPGMSGFEVCQALRSRARDRGPPHHHADGHVLKKVIG